jgi:hypothetical protein
MDGHENETAIGAGGRTKPKGKLLIDGNGVLDCGIKRKEATRGFA